MHSHKLYVLLFLLSGAGFAHGAEAGCPGKGPLKEIHAYPDLMTGQAQFQDYEVRIFDSTPCSGPRFKDPSGLEILKDGKRVYTLGGWSFAIGYAVDEDQPTDSVKIKPGDDITGEGRPDLLVSEWSGRAHCCLTFHIFQLGADIKEIQRIPLRDADESSFVRREGRTSLVLVSNDYSDFAYFPFDFAGSPAGRVFLSYQGNRFKLDAGLMKANAPTAAETTECARLFKKSRDWRNQDEPQPLRLWYYATDLIYTGNADAAWKFLDAAWGGSAADKAQYLGDYRARLKKSVYYPQLMELQKAPASAENQKIDWTKQCLEYMHG